MEALFLPRIVLGIDVLEARLAGDRDLEHNGPLGAHEVWRTCRLDNKAACRVRLQFGGIEFIALRSLLSVRRAPREFKGLQTQILHPESSTAEYAHEFIRRFLLHVLPEGFVRVRHFGFLANRSKKHALPQCRKLLGLALPEIPDQSAHDLLRELTGIDLSRCPACKKGTMVLVAELPKRSAWDSS